MFSIQFNAQVFFIYIKRFISLDNSISSYRTQSSWGYLPLLLHRSEDRTTRREIALPFIISGASLYFFYNYEWGEKERKIQKEGREGGREGGGGGG